MESVRKITHKGQEILVVDYSHSTGDGLIEVFNQAKNIALRDNRHVLILNIFNPRHYISSKFLRHIEHELTEVEWMIDKNVVIGLSETQKWILKGVNLWMKKKVRHFSTEDRALAFLISSEIAS